MPAYIYPGMLHLSLILCPHLKEVAAFYVLSRCSKGTLELAVTGLYLSEAFSTSSCGWHSPDTACVFGAVCELGGVAVGKVARLPDVLICSGCLCPDLCSILGALWKLPGQTDLFTLAQDRSFGPRHALIILPDQMLHQGKHLLEWVSVQLGDQAAPVALETSPTSGESRQWMQKGWISPCAAFCRR